MMQVPGAIIQKVVISVTAHVFFGIFTRLVVKDQIHSQYVYLMVSIFLIIEPKHIKGIMLFNIQIYLDTYYPFIFIQNGAFSAWAFVKIYQHYMEITYELCMNVSAFARGVVDMYPIIHPIIQAMVLWPCLVGALDLTPAKFILTLQIRATKHIPKVKLND